MTRSLVLVSQPSSPSHGICHIPCVLYADWHTGTLCLVSTIPFAVSPFRSAVPLCRCELVSCDVPLLVLVPLPFFRSIATVAVAGENENAGSGNVFPYT